MHSYDLIPSWISYFKGSNLKSPLNNNLSLNVFRKETDSANVLFLVLMSYIWLIETKKRRDFMIFFIEKAAFYKI